MEASYYKVAFNECSKLLLNDPDSLVKRADCAVVQNGKLVPWSDFYSSFVVVNSSGDMSIPLSSTCQKDSLAVTLPLGIRQSGIQSTWLTSLAEDAEISAASLFYMETSHSWSDEDPDLQVSITRIHLQASDGL